MNNDVNFPGGNIPQILLFYKIYSVIKSFSQVDFFLLPKNFKRRLLSSVEESCQPAFSNNFSNDN